ncbi:glycoside hydrolase family 2 TIM barrel-domain containing protein [Phycisphaera mikurensis]|nr:glycoside hydrolase family 2 TIM barrel-domain containing protein [Phycisphaera mikurensis]MBB6440532.1 hypothetical protein [Phycisphaera mikurensis]
MPRTTETLSDWAFAPTDDAAAVEPGFDAASFAPVRVPHDWSVEHGFDERLEGCTGYLPGGFGTYRRAFPTPEVPAGGRVRLTFDGVYNRSEVWLNGRRIHQHPYGYSPFTLDLTDQLAPADQENLIAVRVDRTRYADSRWYTGSGIYRAVTLEVVEALHVAHDGVFVTTPEVSDGHASATVRTEVVHAGAGEVGFVLHQRVLGPDGAEAASTRAGFNSADAGVRAVEQTLEIADPQRWSPDAPTLYTLQTRVERAGEVVDEVETRIGFRTLEHDAARGFFLNGRPTPIRGVCLHHDGGCVGAAVPDAVWERRLRTLKDGGCNAIRTAHNPPSAAFLDLCDRIGFLVQDEFFDEWEFPKDKRKNCREQSVDAITRGYCEHFPTHAEADLKAVMRRDRNHPCVFQWSIGNEIEWTYPAYVEATGFFNMDWQGNYFWSLPPNDRATIRATIEAAGPDPCGETAQRLAGWTRELDTTRPVFANCILPSASLETAYGDALDVMGFSYRRVMYDYAGRHHPEKAVMGGENLGHAHEWQAVQERDRVAGLFLWTGIDYMGESDGQWPRKSTDSGLLDAAGFVKPAWHLMRTLWRPEVPHTHITTQTLDDSLYRVDADGRVLEREPGQWERRLWGWHGVEEHWNWRKGEIVIVEVASTAGELDLVLNGRSLGARRREDFPDRLFKWAVPWEAGELRAVGGGADVGIRTAGPPATLKLSRGPSAMAVAVRSPDAHHVEARLHDADGRRVRHAEAELTFRPDGPGKVLGVDNGSPRSVQPYASDRLTTSQGRALAIVGEAGGGRPLRVTVTGPGLAAATLELDAGA